MENTELESDISDSDKIYETNYFNEKNLKSKIKEYDENTIKKEIENMKKIKEWAKKI